MCTDAVLCGAAWLKTRFGVLWSHSFIFSFCPLFPCTWRSGVLCLGSQRVGWFSPHSVPALVVGRWKLQCFFPAQHHYGLNLKTQLYGAKFLVLAYSCGLGTSFWAVWDWWVLRCQINTEKTQHLPCTEFSNNKLMELWKSWGELTPCSYDIWQAREGYCYWLFLSTVLLCSCAGGWQHSLYCTLEFDAFYTGQFLWTCSINVILNNLLNYRQLGRMSWGDEITGFWEFN